MDNKTSWPKLLGKWCRRPWIIPHQIMPGRTLKEYSKAVGKLMAFWVFSVLGAVALMITEFFGANMPDWGRGLLWAGVVIGLVVSPIVAFHKVMIERDDALENSEDKHATGRDRLIVIHDKLLLLQDSWETGFPAGPEAWRSEVRALYTEAEELIKIHYSPANAHKFRQVQASRDDPYFNSDDETMQRDLLMQAKIGFIYKLFHHQQ